MSERKLDRNQEGNWDCNICEDTGWYGDRGPGQARNSEYVECECQNRENKMTGPNTAEEILLCDKDDCDGKIVLGYQYLTEIIPDQEPYIADQLVDVPNIHTDDILYCHVCEKCGEIKDYWLERDDIEHTAQTLDRLREKVQEMINPQIAAAEEAEKIEEKKGYPKITSTAHHQKAVAFKKVLKLIEEVQDE